MGLLFEGVEYFSVMEVSMGEYAVYSATNAAQLGNRRFFDRNSAREILVAIQ